MPRTLGPKGSVRENLIIAAVFASLAGFTALLRIGFHNLTAYWWIVPICWTAVTITHVIYAVQIFRDQRRVGE